MTVLVLNRILDVLRASPHAQVPVPGDAHLVRLFVERRDEAAFSALVRRHGAMVWGVCLRILGHRQDAEDAFQATFMVLALKASSLRQPNLLANWLFGVAHRTALRARVHAVKRRMREKQLLAVPEPATKERLCGTDFEQCIDQEVAWLPDKYRIAVVLCDLEGKTGKQAAQEIGIPEGTLSTRLRTGRSMLAKRLSRQGIVVSVAVLATLNADSLLDAGISAALISRTAELAPTTSAGTLAAGQDASANVLALTKSVLTRMLFAKCKSLARSFVLLSTMAVGIGAMYVALSQSPELSAEQPVGEKSLPEEREPLFMAADEASGAKKGRPKDSQDARRVVYAVADLVVPIDGMDRPEGLKKAKPRTKEEWLIRKITQSVAPTSWKTAGGNGTLYYSPLDMSLNIHNSAEIQSQVSRFLQSMRGVQNVQICLECRLVKLDDQVRKRLAKHRENRPKDRYLVLSPDENAALLKGAAETDVVSFPKITTFSGQRAKVSLAAHDEKTRNDAVRATISAFVGGNLRLIRLDIKSDFGKVEFNQGVELQEEEVLTCLETSGDENYLLQVTPQIIVLSEP